jgi:hypothetical protein
LASYLFAMIRQSQLATLVELPVINCNHQKHHQSNSEHASPIVASTAPKKTSQTIEIPSNFALRSINQFHRLPTKLAFADPTKSR